MGFGFLGNTGTVGGTVPTATGAALAAKIRGSKEIAVSFFGDGAVNQGVVHEAMNRAGAYGFEGKTLDGNDVEAVFLATETAAKKARTGDGATFLECLTYRWDGHFGGDPGTGYRPKQEIEAWKLKCPIKRLSEKLIEAGQLSAQEFQNLN